MPESPSSRSKASRTAKQEKLPAAHPKPPKRPAKAPFKKTRKASGKSGKAAPAPRDAPSPPVSATIATVLVIGDHPSAALCALMLREAKVDVAMVDIGTTPNTGRLITINPEFFRLHKILEPLRQRLDLVPVRFARFLGPDGESAQSQPKAGDGKPRSPNVLAYIGSMREVQDAMRTLAVEAGVPLLSETLTVDGVDEAGVHVRLGRRTANPKILALADPLPDSAAEPLGVSRFPGRGSRVQATAQLTGGLGATADENALHLSLDLGGQLQWGWLLRRRDEVQLCVQCPPEADVVALLEEWAAILRRHGVLGPEAHPDPHSVRSEDLPLGGALFRDVVARRTLLLGPAGGFYSSSGEDLYPTCWSARYAAEVAAKAVRAEHPQDALGAYRGRWGATLGDYLRGPEQNLRFLLPLVYKNPVMTDRLADAILLGEGLVK